MSGEPPPYRVGAHAEPWLKAGLRAPQALRRSTQWTRSQSIRTAAALPFEVVLVETAEPSVYQRIAETAMHLRELGLSDRVIAARLGVTDKTVAKAIRWLRGTPLP
jgi:hypothetical protein